MSKLEIFTIYAVSWVISFLTVFLMNYNPEEYIEKMIGSTIGISLMIAIVPTVIYAIFNSTKDKKENVIE